MEESILNRVKAEVVVSTARSSGPGGQHANKVETKVILKFNVLQSTSLSDLEKEILKARYHNKMTNEGELIVTCESKRSQLKNKEIAFKKIDKLLAKAFIKKKTRKPTKPSKAAIKKRLSDKKMHSNKKKMRKANHE